MTSSLNGKYDPKQRLIPEDSMDLEFPHQTNYVK